MRTDEDPTRELPCPVCGRALDVESRGPVLIDVCTEHGLWLDRGELESLVSRARARARRSSGRSARRVAQDARGLGRLEGAFLGWVALLFPRR